MEEDMNTILMAGIALIALGILGLVFGGFTATRTSSS